MFVVVCCICACGWLCTVCCVLCFVCFVGCVLCVVYLWLCLWLSSAGCVLRVVCLWLCVVSGCMLPVVVCCLWLCVVGCVLLLAVTGVCGSLCGSVLLGVYCVLCALLVVYCALCVCGSPRMHFMPPAWRKLKCESRKESSSMCVSTLLTTLRSKDRL